MRVSHNELLRTCHKAFETLGFPDGVDCDAAFAVMWLESHGLAGTLLLGPLLPGLEARPPWPLRLEGAGLGELVLDAGGQCALVAASSAVDVACARAQAAGAERGAVIVRHCRLPLFAVPIAARASVRGCSLHLAWRQGSAAFDFVADGERGPFLYGDEKALSETAQEATELQITCLRADVERVRAQLEARRHEPTLAPEDFMRRETASFSRGLEVNDGIWQAVVALSERLLVAATEESRARGAGGGSDND